MPGRAGGAHSDPAIRRSRHFPGGGGEQTGGVPGRQCGQSGALSLQLWRTGLSLLPHQDDGLQETFSRIYRQHSGGPRGGGAEGGSALHQGRIHQGGRQVWLLRLLLLTLHSRNKQTSSLFSTLKPYFDPHQLHVLHMTQVYYQVSVLIQGKVLLCTFPNLKAFSHSSKSAGEFRSDHLQVKLTALYLH